jgi:hypothetical protein
MDSLLGIYQLLQKYSDDDEEIKWFEEAQACIKMQNKNLDSESLGYDINMFGEIRRGGNTSFK